MLRQSSRQSSMASAAGLVDKATSDLLIGPDWAMNLDICDVINGDPGQARDVVKHVKKRLNNKNSRVQLLALTVLETLIKNCGEIVHQQVAEKDVLHEMTKIVKKKSDMQVRDKILVLLDSWQEAFGGSRGRYPQYYMAFEELRRQGVEFPDRTPEHSVPIFTPPQSQPHGQQHGQSQGQSHGPLHGQPHGQGSPATPGYASPRVEAAMSTESSTMSLVDIEAAMSGVEVLSEMLSALNPRDKEAVVDEVIMDLVEQSRTNQRRVMQLVNTTSDEELLGKGLSLNDDLQRVIGKHDAIASGSPMPRDPSTPGGRRFDHDEGTEDDISPLSLRQPMRARPAASSVSPQPAIPPPPGAKMTSMSSQREMTVDLLSGDSFEGAIVPVTVPSQPMQSTPPELALSSNPFDSDPAFHAVPAPPDPQPLYSQSSQPPQQYPFTNGFNSPPAAPPQQYGYQNYPPQQFQQGQPGQSQGMQSSYVVPWASSNPVPQQQAPMYGQGPQSPTQVEAPWGNNNAPGLNQQQYAQQQFAQQQMSPQPMSPQQRAMLYGAASSNATPVLPPPPVQHSLRQQYFQQQQQQQQQQDFSGSPSDLAGRTQNLTLQEQSRYPQNQSLGGQSLAAAAAAAHRQQQQPSPSPPKEVNAADKLFEDLVDLSNPNSRFKTAGILSRGPRNTGSL